MRTAQNSNVRFSPRTAVFITTAAAIYSLGHGLRTFTAVARGRLSLPPSAKR